MTESPFVAGTQLVDRYRIERVLGRGSIATVYLAHDTRLGVERAVKVPLARILAVPTVADRFLSDVQPSLHLDHANVVRLFELGKDEKVVEGSNTIYVTMELVPGGSLADFVRERGPMSQANALVSMRSVLRALQRAHGKGIVHGEVKPSNVLIGKGGVPKLADFGFARILEIPGVREARGIALSAYLSPEQRKGTRPATVHSDVYGAGAMLYSLVTGKDAAGLDDASMRARMLRAIDEPACDVIDRATQPTPDERYASTTEFLDAIEAASSSIGQAVVTDQGVDLDELTAPGTTELTSETAPGPFTAPPELTDPILEPTTDPGRKAPAPPPVAPPIVLERAPARVVRPVSEAEPTEGDAGDPDSVDSFDVRELGLPLRDAEAPAAAPGPIDRADDIASTIRTQTGAAPIGSRVPDLEDPRKKLMAVVAVVTVFLALALLVMLVRPSAGPPAPAVAATPTKTGSAAPAAAPKVQASIQPVTSPDPASWRPPAEVDELTAQLLAAPWM